MTPVTQRLPAREGPPALRSAILLIVVASFFLPLPLSAQYFGRNKVQYEDFDFVTLPTDHFDVYFYREEGEAVEDMMRMSERWYERFARTFQHEFEQSKPLILYADHPDFQQTNTLGGFVGQGTGGVTESLKNRVIMPLTGSYADNNHVLGHELVHAFQYNIAQSRSGGGLQGLTSLPLWLVEGMAEYLSVGREDALTAMWLRDAVRRDDFPTIEQMTEEQRFFPYRFGQGLWAWIGGTFSDDMVIQLYRRSLRVGWDSAVEQLLGMSSDTLSVRWRESVESHYRPLMEGRAAPGEVGTLILGPETEGGRLNIAPSLSPDGRFVAFLSERDLFSVNLYLADARTGEVIRTLSSAASNTHFDALRYIDSSGSWSPDGSRFAFVVFAGGDNDLVVVDVEDGEILRRYSPEGLGAISNPAWSPDGGSIVFSGMDGGISDLYLLDLESGAARQLTDDRYMDFHPDWSPDGRTIAFTSDRGSATDFRLMTFSEPQISLYDMESGQIRTLSIFPDGKHMNPQFSADGQSLYFIADQDGFSDIYNLNLGTGDLRRVTRIATGVSGITSMSPAMSVAEESGTVVYSVFDESEYHIYTLDRAEAVSSETVVAYEENAPGRMLPPADPGRFSRVANYLSDARTGLPPVGTYAMADAEPYDPGLQLDFIGPPSIGVGSDAVVGGYASGGAAAYFSDMLGNRTLGVAVQAQGSFKDIGGQVFYVNRENRWNWGVQAFRIPQIFFQFLPVGDPETGQIVGLSQFRNRFYWNRIAGMTTYPFSRTRRFEASLGATRISNDVEEIRCVQGIGCEDFDRDDLERDPLNMVTAQVAFVTDYSFMGFTSPVRGGRSRFGVELNAGTLDFAQVTADYRRYFNPTRNLTVALRGMHFGRYGSDLTTDQNELIREIFVGYETLVRGYAWESFSNAECEASQSLPGAGADDACPIIARLFGHRIAVANFELRVPFLGTESLGLIEFPYVPTELVAFADAGLAWESSFDDSDPELVFEEATAARVPVFSTGLSARFNVLGFLILEAYYAYPFQRPDKGGHWGFQLAPGW